MIIYGFCYIIIIIIITIFNMMMIIQTEGKDVSEGTRLI